MKKLAAILLAFGSQALLADAGASEGADRLCQADTVGPGGATYGWVNLYRDTGGKIVDENYRMGFEAWRMRAGKNRSDPQDSIEFDAEWTLTDGKFSASSPMIEFSSDGNFRDLELPLRVEVRFDGRKVGESHFERRGDLIVQRIDDGRETTGFNGITMTGLPIGSVPNIFGHRSIEFIAYDLNGAKLERAHIELDWQTIAKKARAAARAARHAPCGPLYYI